LEQNMSRTLLRPRSLGRLCRASCVLVVTLITLSTASTARADCAVTYSITSQWTPGFGASVTVKNTGATAVNGWTLGWTFANGQTITQLWNGVVTQTGAQVSVKDAGYNSSIPANGSVSFGFNGTWSGTNSVPTSFSLNGAVCGGGTTTSYTLGISTVGSGSTTPAAGTYSYASGTTVTVTAVAAAGATFTGWSGAATGTTNPVSIAMNANKTLTANFTTATTTYSLVVNSTGSGSTTPAAGSYSYTSGTTVAVTATAAAGATFTGWSGAATGTTNPVSIAMNANKTLTANFTTATTTYNLTVAASGNGTTTPAAGTYSYASGTTVSVTAVPASGATFTGWSGAATGTTNPVSIVMNASKTLTATFSGSGTTSKSGLPVPPTSGVPKPSGTPGNLTVLDWAGFKGAVSYSFDDAQPSQLQHYAELQAMGIPLTFYINDTNSWQTNFDAIWTQAVKDGHEMGNHTEHHCNANLSGCSGADATNLLEIDNDTTYTFQHFGASGVWTMASPFGDTGWDTYASQRFFLNRGVYGGMVAPNDTSDPFNLPCYAAVGGESVSTFNSNIDTARSTNRWLIFLIHTIMPTSDNWYAPVDISTITGSVSHTKALGDVWADTVVNVGAYWRGQKVLSSVTPTVSGTTQTWTWTLPAHFPPGKYLRVKVDGGTLKQGGNVLVWDAHGYYEVSLDAGSLTLTP
jgi:uncharacterized repeat protein (TIGR02543 family)